MAAALSTTIGRPSAANSQVAQSRTQVLDGGGRRFPSGVFMTWSDIDQPIASLLWRTGRRSFAARTRPLRRGGQAGAPRAIAAHIVPRVPIRLDGPRSTL